MTTNFNFLDMFDEGRDAQKAATMCSNAVNGSCNYSQVVENLPSTGNAELFKACCWRWIAKMAEMYRNRRFDGRNEIACKYALSLMDMKSVQNHMPEETPFTRDFCQYMSYEHRTLQQCFANIAFRLVDVTLSDDEEWKTDRTTLPCDEKYWWRMPLI